MSGPFGSSQWMYNAGGGFYDYSIDGSLRFNDDDSAYLNRTVSSTGSITTATISAWVKRGNLGTEQRIFTSTKTGVDNTVYFDSDGRLGFYVQQSNGNYDWKRSSALHRDVSAWYHIVAVWDSSNATADDRMRLYVNGERITAFFSSINPALNAGVAFFDSTCTHYIGRYTTASLFWDGYLAEVNAIDGTALDPTSFGETKDGVWIPKSYSGSYGTNGFHLKFDDANPTAGYGLSNVTYDSKSFDVSSYTNNGVFSLALNPSGTELFLSGAAVSGAATSNYINKFPLSTAFDISTASTSNVTEYQLTETSSPVTGPFFLNSGSKLYTFANNRIQEYSLSTPYDISTRSYEGDFQLVTSTGATTGSDGGFAFSPDGTKFFKLANAGTKPVYAYSMSTAFDVSTASYLTEISNTSTNIPSNNVTGLAFNSSGTEMYILAVSSTVKGVWVYNLSTGFDLSTASFGSNLTGDFYLTEDSFPKAMRFSPDGKKLLLFGSTNDEVFQYSTERSTIGDDTSGNENDWTPNNFIATDVMPDSPTNNFATWNYLSSTNLTYTVTQDGNLKANMGTGTGTGLTGTFSCKGGKWYWENRASNVGNGLSLGITTGSATTSDMNSKGIFYDIYGNKRVFGTTTGSAGATFAANDIIGMAVDAESAGTIAFYKNNALQFTVTESSILTDDFLPWILNNSSSAGSLSYVNFGQDSTFAGATTAGGNADDNGVGDFKYAPPSGFLSLCSANLPEPVVGPLGDSISTDNFNTVLYTGNGVQDTTISGVGFQPDWVWIKDRTGANTHVLFDSVRGGTKQLFSNLTNSEQTNTDLTNGFASDGFIVGDNVTGTGATNLNNNTYASWNWKAGGTAVSNTAGTITSQVSANVDAGFSIVSYTGTGVTTATVGHGLGVQPSMIIVKNRDISNNNGHFVTYHSALNANSQVSLNLNIQQFLSSAYFGGGVNTSPTTSVFSFANGSGNQGNVNESGDRYIALCFADVEGYSKAGLFTGNGSTDGTCVYTGFRPAFILFKGIDAAYNWTMYDSARDSYNVANHILYAGLNATENTGTPRWDFLSNGFKARDSSNDNTSGQRYIYFAFAEQPFKYANAR